MLPLQLFPWSRSRLRWMQQALGPAGLDGYKVLAQAADISHSDKVHSHAELAQMAKAAVELDRGYAMAEDGYLTVLSKLLQPEVQGYKACLLVGAPEEGVQQGRFRWPWGACSPWAAA